MKNLFDKIFKKEPQLNYIIPEYQPLEANSFNPANKTTEYDVDELEEVDEMQIDKMYRRI
ncbi:MAG: hypothetical protein Q8M99_03075 [Methylotenera sp.]|nr:hypothetical protein [Methylotenera sp.]